MLVSVCFFLSGAAALVLQVLWVRMLGHVFGATALAVSSTLTAFMGGLALGAHLAGRRAPSLKRPLLVFAALETLVGLYGLLVPTLLSWMPAAQRMIGHPEQIGFVGHSLIRFFVVALILIIPTTAMGATLPVLAEGVVKKRVNMASRVGQLYTANTAGAVVGALLGGFVFIPYLGLDTTVYLGAAIDLFVAGIVLVLSRMADGENILVRQRYQSTTADALLAQIEPIEVVDVTPGAERLAVIAFALSGAAAMALQVLWTRAVGVVIGASTYAFTLILTTFLIGLTAGAAVVTRYVDRIANPVLWLGRVQLAVGVFAMVGTLLVDRLPLWIRATALDAGVTIGSLYFTNFAISAVVMLPATFAMGAVMPLVVRVLAPHSDSHAGPIVGRAYTWNTLGAIVGSFAGGFILLPLAGVQTGLAIAAGTSLGVGALLAFGRRDKDRPVLIASLVAVTFLVFAPRWDVSRWTSGLFRVYLARSVFADGWEASGDLVYHRDGIATTVTVERSTEGGGVWLKVNGKVDASDFGDMPTQALSGLLPVLVHGDPKTALVIGYGSGVTPGSVLQTGAEQVTLVELEEAVLEASDRFFSHVNHKPYEDPRFKAVVDDGRNYLLTRDDTFDVIISEPSNPWMSGASSLFTQDFFNVAKSRLADDGVYLQWLQLYELSPANIHALLRTFQSVFPHTLVFTPSPRSNDTLLVGADHPIKLDRGVVERALADPRFRAELLRGEIETPEDFIGLLVVGTEELPGFVGEGPLNTDDNALIEFAAPRDLLEYSEADARLPFVEDVAGKRLGMLNRYFSGFDDQDPAALAAIAYRLVRQGRMPDAAVFAKAARTRLEQVQTTSVALARLDRTEALIRRLDEAASEAVVVDTPETRDEQRYAQVAWALINDNQKRALDLADSPDGFEKISSGHRFLYAYLCYLDGRMIDAQFLIDGVLEDEAFVAEQPGALYYAARIYSERSKYNAAIAYLERYLDAQPAAEP